MGYKCLLVDDEEDVIMAIRGKLDWEDMGFDMPRYAHNGLEALDMAEADTPDVVMTDIRMPYMGGLELAHQLRDLYPNIRIIIFSGFDDFEYAKEAIKVEAEEYILKPVDSDEMKQVFSRIRDSLEREAQERQSIQILSHYYAQSLPLLQENFYTSLVEGRVRRDKLDESLLNYQIDLKGPYYAVVILHTSASRSPEGLNPVLIDISVRRLAEEKMKDKWSARFFSYLGNNVLIAQMNSREQSLELTDYCDRFCRLALKVCKATVTAGIGTVTDDIGGLDESYIGAREAVSYRTVYGAGRAINISEADPGTSRREAVSADEDVLADILRSIRTGREIGIESEVRSYVQNFSKGAPSVRQYQFFTFEVLGKLYKFASDNHLRADDIFAGAANNSDVMDTEELIQFMTDKLTVMKQMIEEGRDRGRTGFVGKALQYVEEHYAEEGITIEKVCHELGVSSAYFSTIFKKETGKTFVTCLTDYRMDRAVELLDNEDLKTYVIAQKVGFSDPNYFSYVFKRKFGVSPSRYRSGQKK